MKKNIIISFVAVSSIGLAAFAYSTKNAPQILDVKSMNWESIETIPDSTKVDESDTDDAFFFSIGPRFRPIQKEAISQAKTLSDFIIDESFKSVQSYQSVEFEIVKNERRTNKKVIGKKGRLSKSQLDFLKELDYSEHFSVQVSCKIRNTETGKLESKHFGPHLTIVPEKQASYSLGFDNFIQFVEKNTLQLTEDFGDLVIRPAILYFTVEANGTLSNIRFGQTSNYVQLDEKIIELMNKLPGTWTPAENSTGEKIEQELSLMYYFDGC